MTISEQLRNTLSEKDVEVEIQLHKKYSMKTTLVFPVVVREASV